MGVATSIRSYKVTAFGQPLRETVEPMPVLKGTEVLLRVDSCGVCHSDLHLADGYFELGGGNRMDLSRGLGLPRTLGHEIAGEVVALGPEAIGVALGQRRIAFPWIGCGACSLCAAGNEHLCARPRGLGTNVDGGYSDHVVVPHPRYLVDFSGIREELACTYACSGLTAYSALRKAEPVSARDPLMVIGAGGVGLAGVRLAQPVTGAVPIVADVSEAKRDAAKAAGASETIDPANPDVRKALVKSTDGGVAAAIDFVGSQASVEFGMSVLRKGGRLIVVGLFGGAINLATPLLPLRAMSLIGSYVGSLEELKALVTLARAGKLGEIPVQTRPLAEAQATLDDLRAGRVVGRAVLKP
jgi:alcohol dehydrogenase/propanol-preferring alcohol dehydrogenase